MTPRAHTVVLADDVLLELEIEKTFLQRSGFKVVTATDGLSALALAISEVPDVVILDQVMPGLPGTEVCKRLRAHPDTRHVPVVITSAHDEEGVRRACQASGVSAFVPKSAGRQELLQVVARILRVPERKSVRITVFFQVQGAIAPESRESLGKGLDVAESGMCLETNRRYEPGSTLSVRFLLPGERHEFRALAVVKRARQRPEGTYEIGLEFVTLTDEERHRLNRYIDRSLGGR